MPGHLSEAVIGVLAATQQNGMPTAGAIPRTIAHETFVREPARGGHVLDLGCGGAEPVARFLMNHGMRVTGVDCSPAMMALARERLPDKEFMVADIRRLVLKRRFEGILAWDGYFHLAHEAQRRSLRYLPRTPATTQS